MKKTVLKPKRKKVSKKNFIYMMIGLITFVIFLLIGNGYYQSRNLKKEFISKQEQQLKRKPTDIRKHLAHSNIQKNKKVLPANNNSIKDNDFKGLMRLNHQAKKMNLSKKGEVRIKEIGLEQPIYPTMNKYTLSLGAAEFFSNQKMGQGNYVLAGHNIRAQYRKKYPGILFSKLPNAKTGMTVQLINSEHIYNYKITKITKLKPNVAGQKPTYNTEPGSLFYRTPESIGEKPKVTLFACIDEGKNRLVVSAEKIN